MVRLYSRPASAFFTGLFSIENFSEPMERAVGAFLNSIDIRIMRCDQSLLPN